VGAACGGDWRKRGGCHALCVCVGGGAPCLRPAAATVCGDMLVLVESSEIDAGYVAHVPRHGVLAHGSGLRVVLNRVWHALELVRKNDL
jgi:hypothetical protein